MAALDIMDAGAAMVDATEAVMADAMAEAAMVVAMADVMVVMAGDATALVKVTHAMGVRVVKAAMASLPLSRNLL
jgi:hypothetical protein